MISNTANTGISSFHETNRVIIKGAGVAYLLPHPALRAWISNYTITFPTECAMSDGYTVIPHGCATLVLAWDGRRFFCNLFGSSTKPVCVGDEANICQTLFITEFHPGGYYAFSGLPQHELTDCVIPFYTINPAMHKLMAHQLEAAPDLHGLVAKMDRLFLAHLRVSSFRPEFSEASQMIVNSGGLVSVRELSQNVFISQRHLNRVFREYIGVNAKSFSRLVRVNRALRFLRRRDYSLSRASMETGFYDVPH
ncbi:MAG: helix-turn-helix domain-containing protein, partial [Gracilibacteraceae bacterium]|nr:helix-turn-helix domain-containing protein [Gracilibacteraceae bacterium]